MDIKIVTTKKKLTKSLLKQMQGPSIVMMSSAANHPKDYILGWVQLDIKHLLICIGGVYSLLPLYNWRKGADKVTIFRSTKNWSTHTRTFTSETSCQQWWDVFQALKEYGGFRHDQIFV